jgi:hypothetical protein
MFYEYKHINIHNTYICLINLYPCYPCYAKQATLNVACQAEQSTIEYNHVLYSYLFLKIVSFTECNIPSLISFYYFVICIIKVINQSVLCLVPCLVLVLCPAGLLASGRMLNGLVWVPFIYDHSSLCSYCLHKTTRICSHR